MPGAPRSGLPALSFAQAPAMLVAALYALLAGIDIILLEGVARVVLSAAAVCAAGAVLALHRRPVDRLTAWSTAAVAVLTLALHVGVAPSRPLMVVMLALAAVSAWDALVATGVRVQRLREPGREARDVPPELAPQQIPVAEAPVPPNPRIHLMETAQRLVDGAVVGLVEPDGGGNLVISACTRAGLVGLTFPAGSTSATEHTYRTGSRLFLADPHLEPLVSPMHLARSRAASVLWEPVLVSQVPCAVLVFGWSERVEEVPERAAAVIKLLSTEASEFLAHESLVADLQQFASTDVLTGLDSRAAWDAQLEELIASSRQSGESLVVAMVDLDHFRSFNHTHGHAAGDAHLARFARAARATLRCDGLIARWGGEEFTVALTAITPQAAHRVLDRVRLAVPDGRTCSIGFAIWDGQESSVLLLSRADRGMHRAKEAGRNRICQAS